MSVTQAHRHFQAGRLAEAEKACRQALRTNRRDAAACRLLAHIAVTRGDDKAAVAAVQKWITAAPKDPEAHAALGEMRVNQGRYDEALSRYDKALRIAADFGPALVGKAEVHLRRQEHEAGLAVLEPFVTRGLEDADMAAAFARLATAAGRAGDAVTVARRHLDDAGVTDETRRSLYYALGKAHEKDDAIDEAFAAYAEANRLTGIRYDPRDDTATADAIIETFSAERLAKLPRPSTPSDLPVFIAGIPRCGSTLTEQIIDAHPKAHGAGELPAMTAIVDDLPFTIGSSMGWPGCVTDLNADDVETIAAGYLGGLRRLGRGAIRVVDKNLFNFRHLGLIEVLFPAARVIHCRRDPVDTCFSCFTEKFPAGTVGFAQDLETLGHAWRQYERLMGHWRAVLTIPWLDVEYERLVRDQEAVSRAVIDFVGLDWDDRCLQFHETKRAVLTLSHGQVSRPMYRTSVGRAERFAAHLGPLKEALRG